MTQRSLWMSILLAVAPAMALAQEEEPAPAGDPASPTEGIGTAEDPMSEEDDDAATYDNPDDPNAVTTDDLDGTAKKKKAPRPTKQTYPIEAIERPLTLTAGQAEVSLEIPLQSLGSDGRSATQILRGAYGVTQDIQIGVSYGFGLELLSPADGQKAYEPGKAFSLDGAYAVLPGKLAATLSIPFYADPFAMSVTLGAPFRIGLTDKLAIVGGENLLQLAVVKMPVDVANPGLNVATVLAAENSIPEPAGHLNINFGVLYQHKPNLAVTARFGMFFPDFGDLTEAYSLSCGVLWSKSNRIDVGGRLGTADIDEFGETFFLSLFAAYRL